MARVYICLFAPSGRRSDQAPEPPAKKCDSPRGCSSSRHVAIGQLDPGRSGVPCGLKPASRAAITSGYRLFDSSGQRCDHPMQMTAPCSTNITWHRDSTVVQKSTILRTRGKWRPSFSCRLPWPRSRSNSATHARGRLQRSISTALRGPAFGAHSARLRRLNAASPRRAQKGPVQVPSRRVPFSY